jgi:PKHD-type hydroxylase
MLLTLQSVLSDAATADIREQSKGLKFQDGRVTAGRFAREVKANDQAAPGKARDHILDRVNAALLAHPVFTSAARPRALSPLILSRYRQGQTYGLHVDDAMMAGLRTDLSFTLFLSEPDTYDGGALIIEDTFEARAIKPAAGDLFIYPSTTLHRVEPVERGERLAVVGWVQSLIRRDDQREILFDLDRSIEDVHAREGKGALFDTLAKTRSNLIRMWAEP